MRIRIRNSVQVQEKEEENDKGAKRGRTLSCVQQFSRLLLILLLLLHLHQLLLVLNELRRNGRNTRVGLRG